MKRILATAVCLALLALVSRPALAYAAASDGQTGPELVRVENYANGAPRLIVEKTVGGRTTGKILTLPGRTIYTFAQVKQIRGYLFTKRSETVYNNGGFEFPKLNESLLSMLSTVFVNTPLIFRAVSDIRAAIGGHFTPEAMENLSDPAKKYEFWKRAGIYDKYTPREIALINSVAFPLAAAEGVVELLLGSAVTASGAAMRLGPWGGLIIGTLVLGGAGLEFWHMMQEINEGRQVDPSWLAKGLTSRITALVSASVGGVAAGTSGLMLAVAKMAGISIQEWASMMQIFTGVPMALVGAEVTVDAAVYLGKLANAWGIPVPREEMVPITEEDKTPIPGPGGSPCNGCGSDETWLIGPPRLEN